MTALCHRSDGGGPGHGRRLHQRGRRRSSDERAQQLRGRGGRRAAARRLRRAAAGMQHCLTLTLTLTSTVARRSPPSCPASSAGSCRCSSNERLGHRLQSNCRLYAVGCASPALDFAQCIMAYMPVSRSWNVQHIAQTHSRLCTRLLTMPAQDCLDCSNATSRSNTQCHAVHDYRAPAGRAEQAGPAGDRRDADQRSDCHAELHHGAQLHRGADGEGVPKAGCAHGAAQVVLRPARMCVLTVCLCSACGHVRCSQGHGMSLHVVLGAAARDVPTATTTTVS